jgi:hypothetical protein
MMRRNVKAGEVILHEGELWVVNCVVSPCKGLPKGRCRLVCLNGCCKWVESLRIPNAKVVRSVRPVCVQISQCNYAEHNERGGIILTHKVPESLAQAIDWVRNHSYRLYEDFDGPFAVSGITFWPFENNGWGEAGYKVEKNGELTFVGADWDSSG